MGGEGFLSERGGDWGEVIRSLMKSRRGENRKYEGYGGFFFFFCFFQQSGTKVEDQSSRSKTL
jgi:hypothetical protein